MGWGIEIICVIQGKGSKQEKELFHSYSKGTVHLFDVFFRDPKSIVSVAGNSLLFRKAALFAEVKACTTQV